MIKKSTNRSGERREENLRIHENCMELLGPQLKVLLHMTKYRMKNI
mgnify:CR=1 FL=1